MRQMTGTDQAGPVVYRVYKIVEKRFWQKLKHSCQTELETLNSKYK